MSERNNDSGRLWGLRAVALSLAVGLWFGISLSNRDATATKAVEATVSYFTPDGLVLIDQPNSVKVTVSGPESEIRTLIPYLVQVQIDLRGKTPGSVSVGVAADDVTLPHPDLSVTSIDPNLLTLDLDRSITRELPLEAWITGEPAAGARVLRDQIAIDPPEATVAGPARFVEPLDKLDLTPINLDGHADEQYKEMVTVVSPNPMVRIVDPTRVEVTIPMDLGTSPTSSGPLEQGL